MAEVINPTPVIEVIEKDLLITRAIEMKRAGRRLSQACAAFIDGKYELSYSFADDQTYEYLTLRVIVDPDEDVTSITEIFPYASFLENEMKELFGVRIQMIQGDYEDRLYRIEKEHPMLTKKNLDEISKYLEEKGISPGEGIAHTPEHPDTNAYGKFVDVPEAKEV